MNTGDAELQMLSTMHFYSLLFLKSYHTNVKTESQSSGSLDTQTLKKWKLKCGMILGSSLSISVC